MDKNRIKGAANQLKGAAKVATGKGLGDSRLVAEGRGEKAAGKLQSAIGRVKDAMKK
jgi:uncharacterized protein YjbJ (UPF0337 family)